MQAFARRKGVKAISLDGPVRAQTLPDPSPVRTTTLRETLGLATVADARAPRGASIGVAIIDSGIAPNADFAGRITAFYDFTNGSGGVAVAPYDDYGHGTHVAGLIGSSGAQSGSAFQGVAPAVRLVGLKVLDSTGAGSTSDVIAALQFVTANKTQLNVQVVNMSLGHPIFAPAADDPLVQAVQQATAAGLIVVTSAGNVGRNATTGVVGYGGITSPCNAPSAICVGAANTNKTVTRSDDSVAPYSSRGPSWYDGFAKPDVLAPGHKLASETVVTSTLYQSLVTSRGQSANGQPLLSLSGTSMAAGVASGVVALVLDAHNRNGLNQQTPLTANAVKAILQYSAIPLAGANVLEQGAGEMNADGAMALAASIDTSQPSRLVVADQGRHAVDGHRGSSRVVGAEPGVGRCDSRRQASSTRTTSSGATNIVWGQTVVWGDNIIQATTSSGATNRSGARTWCMRIASSASASTARARSGATTLSGARASCGTT